MSAYQEAYAALNDAQKQAVDQTDGPVLVIAGPGTGKTQLLSTRIAHILATTDTLPENILCLTFTDAAAANMRERLNNMIGTGAYSVTISTYHAFGNDLLRRYPEFFSEAADLQPADALRIDQVMRSVQAALPYSNGLKHEVFLRDIKSLISDYKRALLSPEDVRSIAHANDAFLAAASSIVTEHIGAMPRITKASIAAFAALLTASESLPESDNSSPAEPLKNLWLSSLADAVAAAEDSGKTTTLTAWKNRWLVKDGQGMFIAGGRDALRKQLAAADIYQRYLQQLTKHKLYDYDDMILQAIRGLESNDDLRFTMQERYQYLLLDEFQDTNEAQLRLVQLLTDNPVNEGRPNVLAVGDDDQAIYAFQGANYSHMLEFYHHYTDTLVVPLTQNYRSGAEILQLSEGISGQIVERLHHNFDAINKHLVPASKPASVTIERQEFLSDLSQNAWVTEKIAQLISGGLTSKNIAVLAPKHQYLESLVPFLRQQGIAVHYEKREDVLADPAITELITMSKLVLALAEQNNQAADALWPQVLSLPFWNLATSSIWQASWNARSGSSWTETLLGDDDLKVIALFFIRLSMQALREPLESTLDYLVGITALPLEEVDQETYKSPFYEHYFGGKKPQADEPVNFWQLLANLTVLRQRLRDYQPEEGVTPTIADFLAFVSAHEAADIKILNTNPYQESDDAVELMTAYKAKGQEFEAVFVLALNDEVWGSRARTQASRIAIPENLRYIRYAGASEDERLRLVYVAFTRAKSQLYLSNFTTSFSGSHLNRLKYLQETSSDDNVTSPLLPPGKQIVQHNDTALPTINDLSVYWHSRHLDGVASPKLKELLAARLNGFQLSATQVTRFTDTSIDGPTSFLMRDLLKFPSGSSLSGTYGDCIHETLNWLLTSYKVKGSVPDLAETLKKFATIIATKRLSEQDAEQLNERGALCLAAYIEQRAHMLQTSDRGEYNFRDEAVFVGDAHLSGKVDRIIVNEDEKTVTIVDFKTGRSHNRWTGEHKMLRYKQQLYFYKLLLENSNTFRNYKVIDAYLEFVEPDETGVIQELHLQFDQAEYEAFKELVQAVWRHIKALDFPSVSEYSKDLKGTLQFQDFLTL